MRRAFALVVALLSCSPASAAPPKPEPASTETVLRWINNYRHRSDPSRLPAAVRALAKLGVLREPESSGVYIGFIAGVLHANPMHAAALIEKTLPLPHDADWAMVRAIAYSGLGDWRELLRGAAPRMPGRQAMIDKYLAGKLPTLDRIKIGPSPPPLERVKDALRVEKYFKAEPAADSFEPGPDFIDTLWGFYFATGSYRPIGRLIELLPFAKEEDDTDKLTLGSMAKYTLASNAARDRDLLVVLKATAPRLPKDTAAQLNEAIEAAESADTARLRKQALAAIEDLKRKGPGYKRKMTLWGQIGQGALSLGCIGAAAAGVVAVGLPCVVGGALSSGALYYLDAQQ